MGEAAALLSSNFTSLSSATLRLSLVARYRLSLEKFFCKALTLLLFVRNEKFFVAALLNSECCVDVVVFFGNFCGTKCVLYSQVAFWY